MLMIISLISPQFTDVSTATEFNNLSECVHVNEFMNCMLMNCMLMNLKLGRLYFIGLSSSFICIVTATMPRGKGNLTRLTTTDFFVL